MRSNNNLWATAALLLGGCSSGWWRDPPPPASEPAPVAAAAGPVGYGGASAGAATGTGYGAADRDLAPPETPQPAYPTLSRAGSERSLPADSLPPPVQNVRYDNVGYAAWSTEAGTVAAAHATLPPGSFAEVTSLDTGKTIVVPITARASGSREIELSGAAAQELGLTGNAAGGVRVRATNPSGGDLAALRTGRPAPPRPDTPPVLLNALRRKLSGTIGQSGGPRDEVTDGPDGPPSGYIPSVPARAAPVRPAPMRPMSRPAAGAGLYVQLAALADPARARAIARQVRGAVVSGGGLHRVRIGPFADARSAAAARDGIAARGYADARIVRQD